MQMHPIARRGIPDFRQQAHSQVMLFPQTGERLAHTHDTVRNLTRVVGIAQDDLKLARRGFGMEQLDGATNIGLRSEGLLERVEERCDAGLVQGATDGKIQAVEGAGKGRLLVYFSLPVDLGEIEQDELEFHAALHFEAELLLRALALIQQEGTGTEGRCRDG